MNPGSHAPAPIGAATLGEAGQLRWAEVRLRWLTGVRWGALLVWVGVACLWLLPAPDTLKALRVLLVVAMGVASNIALTVAIGRGRAIHPGPVLALDIVLFSVVLASCGGATNSFSSFLLVYIALAALIVSPVWIAGLATLAVACHALLFLVAPPTPSGHAMHADNAGFAMHVREMWIAFTLTTALITYFVGRLSAAQRKLELELAATADRLQRSRRLASLGTMAAGAAHELGSPLGTIAVASAELLLRLDRERHPMASDAQLVLDEVRRCRAILDELVADAGLTAGESPRDVTPENLLHGLPEILPGPLAARLRIAVARECDQAMLRLPVRAFQRCALNLIRNAADASATNEPIDIDASLATDGVRIRFRDRGVGMSEDVLSRAGEPFFTTKSPGSGMGLGLYLCHAISTNLGWSFQIQSLPQQGTTAELVIPTLAMQGGR